MPYQPALISYLGESFGDMTTDFTRKREVLGLCRREGLVV
jgi:hypothetical protein